jgi:Uma2 family endonuclease
LKNAVHPAPLHHYSYSDYRSLEEASSTKHEFLNGEIYALVGGTPLHAGLQAAVATTLSNQLTGRECRVYGSDLRVRVLATGLATYPDVTVVCGAVQTDPEDKNAAVNPSLIVEVLSDSTEEYDRGEKLAHYQRIPTLKAVLLVSQRERRIELWERQESWQHVTAESAQTVRIAALQCSLAVTAIYDAAGAP